MIPAMSSIYGPIKQVAYVVNNLDEAIDNWHSQFGITPFAVVRECSPFNGATYRGKPMGEVVLNLGFAYIGDIQLELIEQVNDTPSIYREALEGGAHSLHHYCVAVEDYESAYKHASENGFTTVVDNNGGMAYMESDKIPGLILEIIPWNDFTRPYFDGIGEFLAKVDPQVLKHDYQF